MSEKQKIITANDGQKINVEDYLKGITNITKNVGFMSLGEISTIAFGFITGILITRVVGAKIYGIFLLANGVISILMVFAIFGLGRGVIRYVSIYKAKDDPSRIKGTIVSALIIVFLLSLLFSLLTFPLADIIANYIFHNLQVSLAIRVLIFSLPFLALKCVFTNTIHGFQAIKDFVLVQHVLKPAIRLILLIIFFLLGLRLMGLLLSSVIASIILTVIAYYILIKIFPFISPNIQSVFQTKELINFSWPLFLTSFFGFFIHWTDLLMLGFFLSAKEVGIYGIVFKVAPFITLPLRAFNTVFAPLISELHTKGELERLEKYFKFITKWIFTFSFPVFIFLLLFSDPILRIFGEEFALGVVPLVLISLGELINSSTSSSGLIITMTGRPKLSLLNTALLASQNIIFNYFLIPKYGMVGAAIATSFSLLLINLIRVGEVYYLLRIHPYSLNMLKPLSGGILSLIIFYFLKRKFLNIIKLSKLGIVIPFLLFLALYTMLLYFFRFDIEDRFVLKKISQRIASK